MRHWPENFKIYRLGGAYGPRAIVSMARWPHRSHPRTRFLPIYALAVLFSTREAGSEVVGSRFEAEGQSFLRHLGILGWFSSHSFPVVEN